MARISGVTLPKEKRIVVGLTYVYGIGPKMSRNILIKAGIDESIRVKDLTEQQEVALRKAIEETTKVEGELRREVLTNIKRLKEIQSYRGSRHAKHLPARGQRTKTNNRTVRGNRRVTMGSGKKPTAQKT